MLDRLNVTGFKSIQKAAVKFPRLTVLFGPNAAGKSNLLDAIQALSRVGTERTLSDALSDPIRGHPIEAFAFPKDGLSGLLSEKSAEFALEAELTVGKERFRYRVGVSIQPRSGSLYVRDEYLAALTKEGDVKHTPRIEKDGDRINVRRQKRAARPRHEPLGLNHTVLSDPGYAGTLYRPMERCRQEMGGWRIYYLDPRVAMRSAKPPTETTSVGVLGENIAPFLYRLRAEYPEHFEAVSRTLRSIIPSVRGIDVDLDKRRGTLDILIRQNGTDFSSRIISEGTLRVLALCAIAVNPWSGSLVAFEEPENGVHPRRLELVAQLLVSLATQQNRQVVVTTHSPLFCDAVVKKACDLPEDSRSEIALLNVRHGPEGTTAHSFEAGGTLFQEGEIRDALSSESEDGVFSDLILRGLVDG